MQGASSSGPGPFGKASMPSLETPLLPVAAQQAMSSALCPPRPAPLKGGRIARLPLKERVQRVKFLAPEMPVVSATLEGTGQVIKFPLWTASGSSDSKPASRLGLSLQPPPLSEYVRKQPVPLGLAPETIGCLFLPSEQNPRPHSKKRDCYHRAFRRGQALLRALTRPRLTLTST